MRPVVVEDRQAISTFHAERRKITAVSLTLVRTGGRVNFDGISSSDALKETRVER